jgi:hypothetical protein
VVPADKVDLQEIELPQNQQMVVNRFVKSCQADERIVAAFLGGSHANGTADAYSDVDLYLITTDEAYDGFLVERETFIRPLGEPLFLDDFGTPHAYLYILADGTEGELCIGRESRFHHIHMGPYKVLLDKTGILADAVFPDHEADPAQQMETLRQRVARFWHKVAHFVKAMGRGQLWFAYGQLEEMRRICVNLARLRYDFSDPWVGDEPYFKVEQVLPPEQLAPLQATVCPMEREAIFRAALVLVRFYRGVATTLSEVHGITYPAELERLLVGQLDQLESPDSSKKQEIDE